MPFIPHTEEDVAEMLASIGVASIDDLFDEIPLKLRSAGLTDVPEGLSEMAVSRLVRSRAAQDGFWSNFIGAGAYEHHIPAAIWQIVTRGEFYSAYTPYQAEASQGTLQLTYEYQSMMASLTSMEVSNASLYDGASALGEAILMAVRVSKGEAKRVLVPSTVHPRYRTVARTIVGNQGIELVTLPYCTEQGHTLTESLDRYAAQPAAALVIPQPNFFGTLEPADALTDWAHAHGMLAIAVVNPISLALLKPPGQWGERGADICVGDGQPLGIPLASGGPYFGFMTTRRSLVRQMPGRIVGRTVDAEGRPGFTLTLQAREQHIRRFRATSNICTNQGLLVAAATLYLALMGPEGLREVALTAHARTRALVEKLSALPGVSRVFAGAYFHEAVLKLPANADEVLRALRAQGILGGYPLVRDYAELADTILVCATETKTDADLEDYAQKLARILGR